MPLPSTPRYEAMLSEARELFTRRGYHGTSIREITGRAGASEALVYRHFGSKRELYRRAVLDRFDELVRGHTAPPPGGLAAEIDRLYGFFARNAPLVRSLTGDSALKTDPAGMIAEGGSPLRPVFEHLEVAVRSAVPADRLPGVDVPVAARGCAGLVLAVSVFGDWLFDEPPAHGSAVAELSRLMISGATVGSPSAVPAPLALPAWVPAAPAPDRPSRVLPGQRRRRSRHEVRRLVVGAAREVFAEAGYEAASVREIAARAGVAETSVYRHFGTKEALFEGAVFGQFESWVDEYLARWGTSGRTQLSLEAQTRDYLSATYEMLSANPPLPRSALSGPRAPLLHEIFARLEYQLAKIAERNDIASIPPPLIVRPTFGLLYALATLPQWLAPVPPAPRLTTELTALITYGLTTRPDAARPPGKAKGSE